MRWIVFIFAFSYSFLAAQPNLSSVHSNAFSETVILDTPEKLVIEGVAPTFSFSKVNDEFGDKIQCLGCDQNSEPRSPDLPNYQFAVIAGSNLPQVTVQILASESKFFPNGIAPVPTYSSPTQFKFIRDNALFQTASSATAKVFEFRSLRSVPTRAIRIPLALWSEPNKTLTLIQKFRIEISFPNHFPSRANYALEPEYLSSIKNPIGGVYQYPSLTAKKLFKSAADKIQLGKHFIQIKLGDRNLENLDEDQMVAMSFTDLVKLSSDVNGVSIEDLKIYTGNNDTIPRTMSAPPNSGTLREIPITVIDQNHNGTFDENDSIYFFGHGTSLWKRIPGQHGPIRYEFGSDPYSYENYYYLDFSHNGHSVNRLTSVPSLPKQNQTKTSAYYYLRAEKDLGTSACDISTESAKDDETGYIWYWWWKGSCKGGDSSLILSKSQLEDAETDSLPDLDQSISKDSLYIGIYTPFNERDDSFRIYYGSQKDTFAVIHSDTFSVPKTSGNYHVWTGGIKTAPAFQIEGILWQNGHRFDGYTLSYRKKFALKNKPIWIFPSDFGKPITYTIQDGNNATVLRIEDGVATVKFSLDANGTFTDSLGLDADAKYFVYRSPLKMEPQNLELETLPADGTAMQNLTTGDNLNPDYLIITPRALIKQALALRDYRNDSKRILKVKTAVVVVEDIYRQYSSGRMSPVAIRDFLRYALHGYDLKLSKASNLKYVLFYGDGNYDYRNIRAITLTSPPPNFIPPFEFFAGQGGNPSGSGSGEESATEDFYAALDTTENNFTSGNLDIAIGRLPIQSEAQAAAYLDKIKAYEDPSKAGEWRGRFALAADDATQRGAPNNIDPIGIGHTTSSDELGKVILANEPGLVEDNIYLLDYPFNSSFHKPEAAQDLLNLINRGTLLVNYVGHGASNQWADEVLLQTNDALSRMHNEGQLPMINAFSCTVGRFESLTSEGMSEQFVKQPSIGAIAAVSSTRESYPDRNITLATKFYADVFPTHSQTSSLTVGRALQNAKNNARGGINDSKYALLGEPVLLLRKQRLQIEISNSPDTIQALDCNTIKGKIMGGSGSGKVNVKILAGFVHKDYVLNNSALTDQKVDKHGNILFEQTVPYTNNTFSVDYFIPKQIPFGDSTAQITAFAWDAVEEREGDFAKQNLRIQGTAKSSCATDSDGKGPRIKITGCQTKETAGIDFPNEVKVALPYCFQIEVQDSSGGVSSAPGPDEGTTVEIPGVIDPYHPQAGVDGLYLKTYQLSLDTQSIQAGHHLLKVSARDGFGNLSQRQLSMDVTTDRSLNTVSAYNIPNPMKRNGTTFYFSTIMPAPEVDFGDPTKTNRVNFEIRIFNQTGSLVKVFKHAVSGAVNWDGRDEWGQLLANGIYFYSIIASETAVSSGPNPTYKTISSKRNTLVISR